MVNQHNYSGFVLLVLVILGVFIGFGVLLTGTELLNPTSAALEAQSLATESALSARATALAVQATSAPLVQTAAAEANAVQAEAAALAATQTVQALELDARVQQLAAQQTQAAYGQTALDQAVRATGTQLAVQARQAVDAQTNANRHAFAIDFALVVLTITVGGCSLIVAAAILRRTGGRPQKAPAPSLPGPAQPSEPRAALSRPARLYANHPAAPALKVDRRN